MDQTPSRGGKKDIKNRRRTWGGELREASEPIWQAGVGEGRGRKEEIQGLACSPWDRFNQKDWERDSKEEGIWESLSAWAAELRADLMSLYTHCAFQGILDSSSWMSTVANFCNHKRTSHMMQLTPWRYLEKGRCRMERGKEGGGWRKRKVYKGRCCLREKMYKYGFNPAKCLWQEAAAPSLQDCSLSDRESN